jgi:hypothetical protein
VLAVQREGDEDDSPTTLISAHQLGMASRDTLSPVLTAMGIDLAHQQVIKKRNNVILEEISCFYYLQAFWHLTGETQDAHFIAATGVDNVETLANMFMGWGLDFVVAVDDDRHGRGVYNELKRLLCGDDDAIAKTKLMKFAGLNGIEDAFSRSDFARYVIKNAKTIPSTASNSEFMKTSGISKPVAAYKFLLDARQGTVAFTTLEQASQECIRKIVSGIVSRLSKQPRT